MVMGSGDGGGDDGGNDGGNDGEVVRVMVVLWYMLRS